MGRITEGLVKPLAGGSTKDAFVRASRAILLDVLCPILFEAPVLTKEELLKQFREGTMTAYLTAIFYSQQNLDALAVMGEKGRKKFKEGIDPSTQRFLDVNKTAAYFLEKYLALVASPQIADQLINGVRQLEEAETVLATAAVTSIAEIVALRPHRSLTVDGGATVRKTPSQPEQIANAVGDLATKIVRTDPRVVQGSLRVKNKKVKEQAKEASANGVAGAGTSTADSGSAAASETSETGAGSPPDIGEEASDSPDPTEEKPGAGTIGNSQLGKTAVTRVEDVLSIFFDSQPEREVSPNEIDDLSKKASLKLTGDKDFMRDVHGNMDAFKEALHLIYSRYAIADADKLEFRNEVERLTLVNIMLLHQKDLALGTAPSNLYSLLIDLIKFTDPQNLDRSDFIKNVSLTRFFTEEQLKQTGDLSGTI